MGVKCTYCGNEMQEWPKGEEYKKAKRLGLLRGKRLRSIDHKLPQSRGGSNSPDNLVDVCLSCNSSKNNQTLDEWSRS